MNARILFRSLAVGLLSLLPSGCALTHQIKYDPARMHLCPAQIGELRPGDPLEKKQVNQFLMGSNLTEFDPQNFAVDPARVKPIFRPRDDEVFSFVSIADIQIEDPSLGFGPRLTRFIDKHPMRLETTVRGFHQGQADVFYLAYLLNAVRLGLAVNTNLQAVIHLGDAMQFGREAELAAFNEMIGKFLIAGQAKDWERRWTGTWLETPIAMNGREVCWINLLGNHDVYFMGNLTGNFPVRSPDAIVTSSETLEAMLHRTPPFNSPDAAARTNLTALRGRTGGYYTMDRPMRDGTKVRLIFLNTNERNLLDPLFPKLQRGALYPSLSSEQFDWLATTLECAQADDAVALVLVFGHNLLAEITVNRTGKRADRDASFGEVKALLGRYSKVQAYFCGHLHSGSPPKEYHFGSHVVTEYISPSVQEFPKSFGVVSVCKAASSGGYTLSVRYHNLEDLMDLDALPAVEVREDTPPYDQQSRFTQWLAELDRTARSPRERLQLLAKYCYESSRYDVQHDLRTDIGLCSNPKLARDLMIEYAAAQAHWVQMKNQPEWKALQLVLDSTPAAGAAVQVVTGN